MLEDEARKLESSLDQSKMNSNRLHKESEQVITNVNSWVQEQRSNSEKFTLKIQEQAIQLAKLAGERDSLLKDNEALKQHIKAFNQTIGANLSEKENIKV